MKSHISKTKMLRIKAICYHGSTINSSAVSVPA